MDEMCIRDRDQSDEKEQLYKNISSYFNEIRTLNSTRYIYTAKRNEEGKLVYVVDGLDPNADDVRHPGDYICLLYTSRCV